MRIATAAFLLLAQCVQPAYAAGVGDVVEATGPVCATPELVRNVIAAKLTADQIDNLPRCRVLHWAGTLREQVGRFVDTDGTPWVIWQVGLDVFTALPDASKAI